MKRILVGLAVLAVLAVLVLGALVGWAWWSLEQPYKGYGGEGRTVVVEPGTPADRILEQLDRAGVVDDGELARVYLVWVLGDPALKAGEYRFTGEMTPREVLRKLIAGDIVTHPVTIVEGLTLAETAQGLMNAGFGDRGRFLELMRSPELTAELIGDLDPEAPDLEGYLFPDTYTFPRGTSEREIVVTLVDTFRQRFETEVVPLLAERYGQAAEPAGAPAVDTRAPAGDTRAPAVDTRAPAAGDTAAPEAAEGDRAPEPRYDVRDLVTLASVVEKEAKIHEERPLIAAVYQNRLDRGIGLYADPTVVFALKQLGRWDGDIRSADLRMDHPYNTYRNRGLPPGPICSPGLASLKAAAAPAGVPHLYFVSRNDGSHVFSDTLAEHNRNVERWQRRYWRERRAAEAEEEAAKAAEPGDDESR